MKAIVFIVYSFLNLYVHAYAQEADVLVQRIKTKIELVKNYEAAGFMKTNVPFLKVPSAEVKVYFKSPDKFKIKNEKGISLVPRGTISMSLSNLLSDKQFTAIPAGNGKVYGIPVRIIKLLPVDGNAEVVLSTLYIDVARLLVLKAVTTTRENGTYELVMQYGKFAAYALPDKALFTFNVKEYKLPKGVTFDYDDGSKKKKTEQAQSNKGMLEVSYKNYIINKGIPDSIFQ